MTDISMFNTPYMSADCVDEVLKKCENFADTLKLIVSDLKHQGNTQRSLPAFPRTELLEIMGKEKPQKTILTGEELHKYLQGKSTPVQLKKPAIPWPRDTDEKCTVEEIIPKLVENYELLNAKKAVLFGASLSYGRWLELLYNKLKHGKTDRRSISFKKLIKEKIGISDGYARQLRILAKRFKHFRGFYYLSISINEFWQRREEIQQMLEDPQLKQFWQ